MTNQHETDPEFPNGYCSYCGLYSVYWDKIPTCPVERTPEDTVWVVRIRLRNEPSFGYLSVILFDNKDAANKCLEDYNSSESNRYKAFLEPILPRSSW